jgi:hypothetical protein
VKRSRPLAFALIALGTAFTVLAGAQTRRPPRGAAKKPAVTRPAPAAPAADDPDAAAPIAPQDEKAQPAAAKDVTDAGAVAVEKTGDAGKVFRFGEVEVEGRLKSPQIVYFLRRVRAEFAAGDLCHRTFLPELQETRHEPVF